MQVEIKLLEGKWTPKRKTVLVLFGEVVMKSINKPRVSGSFLNQYKDLEENTFMYPAAKEPQTATCTLKYKCIKTDQQPHEQI